ncbi:MAG: hypothetical protein RL425_38, partial [Pseudomonadota bacterium]
PLHHADHRLLKDWGSYCGGSHPSQRTAQRQGQSSKHQGQPNSAPQAQGKAQSRKTCPSEENGHPHACDWENEPACDPAPQHDGQPERQLVALQLQPKLQLVEPQPNRAVHACLKRVPSRARGLAVYSGHSLFVGESVRGCKRRK